MPVEFYNQDTDFTVENPDKISTWIEEAIVDDDAELGEITVIFCSDEYLLELNKKSLNHDYYTDVITFNNTVDNIISGDIYISVDTVSDNATVYSTTFENELLRVIIHGVLHLIGFNDESDDEKKEMQQQEDLQLIKFKNIS